MENSALKTFGKILLGLLIPFVIIFYCFILPAEEAKYAEDFKDQEEIGKESKQSKPEQKHEDPNRQEDLIKGVALSSFSKYITQDEMNALNGALSKIDSSNEKDIQKITSIFLESMGYPSDMITVEYHSEGNTKFEGDMQAGLFMPSSGKLSINSRFAQYGEKGTIIGVVRHELDHFDKFSKLCKAVGIESFTKFFGGNINREFWQRAIGYASLNNFDKSKYLKAIRTNEYTDITSFYQVFVEKSNDVRNPFELTAYAFSDYVESYYKVNKERETNVKKVGKAFNQVDWQIYKIANKNKYLTRSRSAIFDYYYLRAMMTYNPSVKTAYESAVKNGNITGFWEECQKLFNGLQNNVLSSDEAENLIKILNSMNLAMNSEITNKQINGILQLKYLTLKDAAKNPKYANYRGNLAVLLSININDYLSFLDVYATGDDSMKLKLLITKYWLSTIHVKKESGGIYDFTKGESRGSIEKKIKNLKSFKDAQKSSGLSEDKYFESLINKNKAFP